MKYLLDTHLLLWAAGSGPGDSSPLPGKAASLIDDPANSLYFSAVSIWEIAIKSTLGRVDFKVDAPLFRRALLDNGYEELPITSAHAAAVTTLPALHKDPFDRMLVAQAGLEGLLLLTSDYQVAAYPGPIQRV